MKPLCAACVCFKILCYVAIIYVTKLRQFLSGHSVTINH